jgi:hypothetical protein
MDQITQSIEYRCQQNRARPCSVDGCGESRYGTSLYCLAHMRATRAHGHPKGVAIFPKQYVAERAEAAGVIGRNPSHPGIVTALSWLKEWLEGQRGAAQEAARLADHGVEPRRVLEECAAVWMLSHRRPGQLPDDARLTFALSRAVLHLAPRRVRKIYQYGSRTARRYQSASREARRELGEAIRRTLGVLLQQISMEPERALRAESARQEAFATPFTS